MLLVLVWATLLATSHPSTAETLLVSIVVGLVISYVVPSIKASWIAPTMR